MGRPATCHCGECRLCRKRVVARAYYRENAEKLRRLARKSRLKRLNQVRAYDRKRGYREYDPLKARARRAVSHAVADGRLIRRPCEVCRATENVDAHHDDYSLPLDVRWLCRPHHAELHRSIAA